MAQEGSQNVGHTGTNKIKKGKYWYYSSIDIVTDSVTLLDPSYTNIYQFKTYYKGLVA